MRIAFISYIILIVFFGCSVPDAPTVPAAPSVVSGDARLLVYWAPVNGSSSYEVWYGETDDPAAAGQYDGDIMARYLFIMGLANGWQGVMPWTSNGIDVNGGFDDLVPWSFAFFRAHPTLVFPN